MTLLAWLLLALVPRAPAGPDPAAELVAELLDRAREGALTPDWIEANVRPGPHGWTEGHRQAWARALAPDAPLVRALQRASGVVHVGRGEGPTVVVVEAAPLLAFVVDERDGVALRAVEPTTCLACDARVRFASDLLADVRRRGAVFPRLRPGVELEIDGFLATAGRAFDRQWPALLDVYLASDAALGRLLGGAVVLGPGGDGVRVRYPDGREDTWVVAWDPHTLTGRLVYQALAPDSPLRLEGASLAAWRRASTEQDARVAGWRPSQRLRPDGAGRQLGASAVGAVVDARDDTALVLALEGDRSLSALFRVAPETGEVLARHPGPVLPARLRLPEGGGYGHWPLSLAPSGDRLAVALPDGVHLLDLPAEGAWRRVAVGRVAALGWRGDGALLVAHPDGRVEVDGASIRAPVAGPPLAVHADPSGAVEVVTAAGQVLTVPPEGDADERAKVCGGDAVAAARRERDGAWLVACGPTSPTSHAVVASHGGAVQAFPGAGSPAGAVAWSSDGEHYLVPAPGGGSILWADLHDRPQARFGRTVLVSAAFSPDGDHLLGVTDQGDVVWWDLATVRRLHWVDPDAAAEASGG